MFDELILVGGGGHCKSVIDAAESSGFRIKGILDIPANIGKKVLNYNIIGSDDDILKYAKDAFFVVTVGQLDNADLRIKLHDRILNAGGKLAIIIASSAYVSKHALLGEGTVVLHHATVNANACIGKGCIINTLSNIEHDVVVGDFTHISTGVMINGECKVGSFVFVGSQSVLKHGVLLADNVVIGAGTFVKNDVLSNGVYVGKPAQRIK
jgi:sugar O-acyltransferase (sialic acid O-acetyltransferase NeuD family)